MCEDDDINTLIADFINKKYLKLFAQTEKDHATPSI
jgi:hypothetical protein